MYTVRFLLVLEHGSVWLGVPALTKYSSVMCSLILSANIYLLFWPATGYFLRHKFYQL